MSKSQKTESSTLEESNKKLISYEKVQDTSTENEDTQKLILDKRKKCTKRDGLTRCKVAAYTVGHLNNDLIAATMVIYVNWYITKVVQLSPMWSGLVFLAG